MKLCDRINCKTPFEPIHSRQRYCSTECCDLDKIEAKRRKRAALNKSGRAPVIYRRIKKKPTVDNRDAIQRENDKALHDKYKDRYMSSEVTIYRPGDPGFDEVAKKITPVKFVRGSVYWL